MRLIIKNAILRINLTVHGAALPTPNKKKKKKKKKKTKKIKVGKEGRILGIKYIVEERSCRMPHL